MLGLHWDDIDLDAKTMTIRRSYSNYRIGKTKNSRERTVDLSPQLAQALSDHRLSELLRYMKLGKKPFIVFSKDGAYTDYHTIWNAWKKMLTSIGIPYMKMYAIRHTGASLMIDAGVPVKETQHTLGHHSSQFTLRCLFTSSEAGQGSDKSARSVRF